MTGGDWGIILFLSLLWGGAFFMIALGLRSFPPITLAFMRMALAVPPMLLALKYLGQKLPTDSRSWRQLFVLGGLNAAFPFMLFFWGQSYISTGLGSILNATTPLWGVVLAHLFTRDEKATPSRLLGVLLGLAGIVVMVGAVLAQLACLSATVLYALAAIYGRTLSQSTMTPIVVATGQVFTAAVLILPFMLVFDHPWTLPFARWDAWIGAIGLAIPSTAFAYFLYFRLIDRAGASNAMLVAFIMPVVAIVLGVVALGESVSVKEMIGAALIALGLVAIDGRVFAKLARTRSVP
jgi:drug/metabolite transporter (DMT)-like permease